MYKNYFKRIIDFFLSLAGIIILSPLLLILVVFIKAGSKGPIIFKQKRIGKDKETFLIYKFRTMYIDAPSEMPTHLLSNPDMYITFIGKFLRKTSLDELPQLFNILIGEMAVIGPRPALWNQYDLIELRDKYNANSIRPGLTGLAQISGRDELEIDKKAKIDEYYTQNISFGLDFRCFFGTIISVFKYDGIVEGGTGQINDSDKKEIE